MDHLTVIAARQGDGRAFSRLVQAQANAVCSIAAAITRDLHLAEEVSQQVFITAWKDLDKLRDPSRFAPWLHQITRNRSYEALRRRTRRNEVPLAPDSPDGPDAEQALLNAEADATLQRALHQLTVDHREVLLLYYWEDRSLRQVAEALSLPEPTVRKRLSRARSKLKREICERLGDALEKRTPGPAVIAAVALALASAGRPAAAASPHTVGWAGMAAGGLLMGALLLPGIRCHRPDAPPLASATTLHSTDASIEPPRAGAVADPDPIAAPSSVVTVPEEAIWRRCALPDLPDDLTTQAILEIHGEQSVIGSQVTIEAGALLMPDHADSWLATIHHHRVSADVGDARYTFTLDVRLDRPCAVEDVAIVPYHTEEIRCPITVASPIASLSEDDATVFQTTEQPPLDDASGPALLTRGRVDGDTLIIHGPPSGQGMLEVEIHAGAAGASSLAQSVSWRDGQCAPIVIREPVHVEGTVNLDDTDPSRPPMCVLETCSPRRAGHNGHFAVDISPDDLPCAIYAICHFDTYRRESAPVLIDAAPGETITVDFDPEETRLIIVDIQTYHTPNGYGINSVRFRSDAERVGLMKGDVIVAIDGILTHTLSHDDFQTLYAGPIGEDVELLVTREGVEERLRFRRGGAEARR